MQHRSKLCFFQDAGQSTHLICSYKLSTMPSVVSHDIFAWSPVNTCKSQQCCQTAGLSLLRAFVKWAVGRLAPRVYLSILDLLLPLAFLSHIKLLTAVLRISLIFLQSTGINSWHYNVQIKQGCPVPANAKPYKTLGDLRGYGSDIVIQK